MRVRISLLAVPGTKLSQVSDAMSHPVLLGQCRGFMRRHGIRGLVGADTAGSALEISRRGETSLAALAAPLAGEIYGLDELAADIEDRHNNTTRFLIMSRQPDLSRRTNRDGDGTMMTSFVFRVRNIPAALYKAMGGFATNGVNMTKLESYMVDGVFTATQFYADIEGHPEDANVARALEELDYFTTSLNVLGVYPADPLRARQSVLPD